MSQTFDSLEDERSLMERRAAQAGSNITICWIGVAVSMGFIVSSVLAPGAWYADGSHPQFGLGVGVAGLIFSGGCLVHFLDKRKHLQRKVVSLNARIAELKTLEKAD